MSVENIELLINQAEHADKIETEETQKVTPGYESAEDIRQRCKERAVWIVGGVEATLKFLKPEATPHVMTDDHCNEGVKAIADVLVKYPESEPPAWLKKLLTYKEEAVLCFWLFQTTRAVHEVDILLQAAKEAAANESGEGE